MPPFGLTLLVASIGFADSINPSTVVPALYLASGPRGRGLGSYTIGVFAVYLAGGLLLVLGPGPDLIAALHNVGPSVENVVKAVAGAAALVFAVFLWRSHSDADAEPKPRRFSTRGSAFALGAGITALELPTAFPYFGALSAILASHAVAPAQVSLVIAYNAVFVLPLVLVVTLRSRLEPRLGALVSWLRRYASRTLAVVAAVAGGVLLGSGLAGLV